MFYERRETTPREWIRRMKQSLACISPAFDCRRMVANYMSELYDPANQSHQRIRAGGYERIREKVRWNARIREVWDRVRFVESSPAPVQAVTSGAAVAVRASIELAGLTAADVRVELVMGRVDSNGHLEETEVQVLPSIEQQGSVAIFGKDVVPERTGRLGYALRVSPNHYEDPLTRPCGSLLKWSSAG
jgi:starch phosphorylase